MGLFNSIRSGDAALQGALQRLARELSETVLSGLISEIISNKRRMNALLTLPLPELLDRLWKRLGANPEESFASLAAVHFVYDDAQLATLRACAAAQLAIGSQTDMRTGNALAAFFSSNRGEEHISAYVSGFFTDKGTPYKSISTKKLDAVLAEALAAEQARVLAFQQAWSAHRVASHTADVLTLAGSLLALYERIKFNHAQMDYDDLILTAVRLLEREGVAPWVLFKLDGGIDHILVDEAQDTSGEQWRIIQALTQEFFAGLGRKDAERSLFVVGDEKQSIYSFQGADPTALARMQQLFKARIESAARAVHVMELKRSYRSTPEVLQAVDAVFAQADARKGLMFQDVATQHIATREKKGLVEVWPLTQPREEGAYRLSAGTALARQMATTIKGWIDSGEARAGDIMVLVRTRSGFVDKLTRALKKQHVPVAGHDRMELLENLAVQDLIALGQCLLLPEDNLTLASLLKSPIFNISEEQLFELSHGRGKHSLWDRLRSFGTRPEYSEALQLLEDLRARADYSAPFELYAYLLDTRGARTRFTGRMGEEYGDPLDEFLNQTLLYEASHSPSLQGFIHWMTHSRSEIKRDMEQAQNAVRIMTVHGAKGLQAPIIFLPDTTELPKLRESLLWHEEEGHMLPLRPPAVSQMEEKSASVRAAMRESMLAEYRRLLYVALTRAEDRIYVCGTLIRGEAAGEESWYHLIRTGLSDIATRIEREEGMLLRLGEAIAGQASAMPAGIAASEATFLRKAPPAEPLPPQPLSPSRLEGEEPAGASPLLSGSIYQRGNLIHSLLQYLPEIAPEHRLPNAKRLAALRAHGLEKEAVEECIGEVLAILGDERFSFLFGAGSLAEVPVAGCVELGGKPVAVAGQIDRLFIGERDVWIVDFKSNRNPPATGMPIPSAYIRQLRLYQLVLQAIYPERNVRCALLWTASAALTMLDEALLRTYI